MIIYGIQPTLTDRNGEAYGTIKEKLSMTLGRREIFFAGIVGENKVVYEAYRELEVKQPPIIVKQSLPFTIGREKDFMNSREVYD